MNFLTDELREQLISNFNENRELSDSGKDEADFRPILKLFTPGGNATWLLTEMDEESCLAFGLCDLGLGFPEVGWVSLEELAAVRDGLGLPVERDLHFVASKTLREYAEEAADLGRVVA
ncbi:DUF2958 domain-containing protein [Luteolibacter sp. LG18]|uniref:DUF2958 domain-containing protein n=1 Tax=Luteolibacter sp. LG18 TaxID=2819286 RepID=UPI0030C70473